MTTPNPYPFVNVPISPVPPSRFVKRGGYMVCTLCGLVVEYCCCAKAPPPPPAQGDGVDTSLERRVREVRQAMLISADDPMKLHCGYCGRVLERPGCGCQTT